MNIEDEIHAINKKLGELMTSITLLKERRANDKENTEALSNQVKEDRAILSKQISDLAVAVNRLNLTIAKSEGKSEGISLTVKIVRILIGSIIFTIFIGSATLMFDMNNRITILESEAK